MSWGVSFESLTSSSILHSFSETSDGVETETFFWDGFVKNVEIDFCPCDFLSPHVAPCAFA